MNTPFSQSRWISASHSGEALADEIRHRVACARHHAETQSRLPQVQTARRHGPGHLAGPLHEAVKQTRIGTQR